MAIKHPVHPGLLVKTELEALARSTAEAAAGMGVTRQQLHNVVTGRSSVTPEMAYRLEQAIGGTADTWLQMQTAFDLAQIRQRSPAIKVARLEPKTA